MTVVYHGTTYSVRQLSRLVGVSFYMIRRWHLAGMLTESALDAYINRRADHWLMLELAESNGITLAQYNDRLRLGWDPQRAATEPVQDKYRRKGCGRRRAA